MIHREGQGRRRTDVAATRLLGMFDDERLRRPPGDGEPRRLVGDGERPDSDPLLFERREERYI